MHQLPELRQDRSADVVLNDAAANSPTGVSPAVWGANRPPGCQPKLLGGRAPDQQGPAQCACPRWRVRHLCHSTYVPSAWLRRQYDL